MTGRIRKWVAVFVSVLFVAGVLAMFYVFMLAPRYREIDQLAAVLESEKKVLAAMEQHASPQEGDMMESLAALQKKVPVRPLTEQLLLEFQKAEYISGSVLLSVNFSEGGKAAAGQAGEGKTGTPPDGIETVSAQLTVRSPSYYQLERFLETLERSERILAVESITFAGPPELTSTAVEVQPLTYSLTVRAFYAPQLEKWKQLAPMRDVPPPSGKDNPFVEIAPPAGP